MSPVPPDIRLRAVPIGAAFAKLGGAVLVLALAGLSPAQAQIGTWDFSSMLATNQELASSACLAGRCGAPAHRGAVSRPSVAAAAIDRPVPRGAPQVSLRYVPSPAVHQRVLADLVARIRARNPQDAQQIQAIFAQYDYAGLYDGIAGPYGLSGNDAGNAMTAYLILGWLIANGRQDLPAGRAAAMAARAQVAGTLAESGTVPREAWAELGEELKLQFVIAHAGWLSAMKEGHARRYADGIARQFQQVYGIDLRRTSLDASGLHRPG
jgi:hypothetical protein